MYIWNELQGKYKANAEQDRSKGTKKNVATLGSFSGIRIPKNFRVVRLEYIYNNYWYVCVCNEARLFLYSYINGIRVDLPGTRPGHQFTQKVENTSTS